MRKLASIQKISSLEAIPNADKIQVATILGWHVVVPKDTFKVGDKVVYVEVDSVLPDSKDHPEFEFMRDRKFRVKTIKLRGQVSQGIAFPLTVLKGNKGYKEDQDVTEELGIKQYRDDAELDNQSRYIPKYRWLPTWLRDLILFLVPHDKAIELLYTCIGKNFPDFIPKTDETRVQVLQPLLDKYEGTQCYASEKLDGKSITIYMKTNEFGVCSRDLDIKQIEGNSNIYWDTVVRHDIKYRMNIGLPAGLNVALQGELMGPGILGNKLNLKEPKIFFYNVFNIDAQRYLDKEEFIKLIMCDLNLDIAPIPYPSFKLTNSIDDLVKLAQGKSMINKDVEREGLVIRPLIEIEEREVSRSYLSRDRVSFKVINPNFLLKFEKED